ncbi:glycosyltransferase [Conexibacter sp. CPCC 206217]|uniref:glycosyltransferase n=1 Tax=Conexibacter sp. CPCC 206217 TaxID=3064574 RepID=UPI0027172B44|nr:glycosyltransferase [Conexibacter sp. CPCC 206217]MDO8209853.1 glycosyltransferase [Conexibacter sp. CPCC 206217]
MSVPRPRADRRACARTSSASLLALLGVAAVGPVGYPAWLAWQTRGARDASAPPAPPAGEWPGITVVVPAYLEQGIIAAKLDDVEQAGYPGELQIVVIADDPETAAAARRPGVELIEPSERGGKAAALNHGFGAARHPIVVMSDANAMLVPGTLQALARWFSDPTVGAVAGEKRIAGEHEGAYWRFESWLKRRESARGSTIGLVGELGAVRRDAFRPLPTDLAVDDLWLALDVLEQGLRIAYEPDAAALEEAGESLREDWERRTRVVSGAFDVLLRRREMLAPGSPVAIELWGHRLVRMSAGPIAHAVLLAWSLLRMRRRPAAAAFALGHLVAAQALVRSARGGSVSKPEGIAAQVLFLQIVAFGGMARYLRRDRPALWPKQAR